jgi:hypothetical protein
MTLPSDDARIGARWLAKEAVFDGPWVIRGDQREY